jgi:hypothetical protein
MRKKRPLGSIKTICQVLPELDTVAFLPHDKVTTGKKHFTDNGGMRCTPANQHLSGKRLYADFQK